MRFILFLIFAFIGYSIGRTGHVLGGQLYLPHHWMYGVIMMIVGFIFMHSLLGRIIFAAGFGLIVSDFKDMISFKFIGIDDVEVVRFWGID